jgi:membrane-associated phospholipid phosphatase
VSLKFLFISHLLLATVAYSQTLNKDGRYIYYSTIASLYGIAEILPEHQPWLPSNLEKQKLKSKNTVWAYTPVIAAFTTMLVISEPSRGSYANRIDGRNNFIGLFDAMAFEHGVTQLVKNLVRRERPNKEKAPVSFWSGHAAVSFTSAHYISRYIQDYSSADRSVKSASAGTLYALAAYVAWTRIGDNQHHWSDIILGSIWGIVASNIIYDVRNNGKLNLFEKQQAKPTQTILNFSYRF